MNKKIQLDILEENQHHLYIACKACKVNFVVPNFWFLAWNCNDFPSFGALIEAAFRTMIHRVHRKYSRISIFSEIRLVCFLFKNINYNFTRLTMFYLKHLYSKTLDVSMMNWDWPIFFFYPPQKYPFWESNLANIENMSS